MHDFTVVNNGESKTVFDLGVLMLEMAIDSFVLSEKLSELSCESQLIDLLISIKQMIVANAK